MIKFLSALFAVAILSFSAPAIAADVSSACGPTGPVLVQVTNSNAVSAIGNSTACLRELIGDQEGDAGSDDE